MNNRKICIVIISTWLIVALAGIYLNGATDTRTDNFGNIGLFTWNALWMSLGIIYIAYILRHFSLMEYLGKRTLAILVMHKYPIMALKLVPFVQKELQAGNFIVEIAVTVLTILCCLIAEKLIARFLPQLFGRF